MQKDHPQTPKLRRIRRMRNASTPEPVKKSIADNSTINSRGGTAHHRATMAPSDFNLPQNFPRRRIAIERPSMLPSQVLLDGPKTVDTECNDTELKLLYDEYLQKIMTEIVIKKKAEERKRLILTQLATVAKECDHDEKKLFKLRTRERDIITLTTAQNEVDTQIVEANNCTKNEEIKIIKDTLSQLYALLKPLDVLRCNNMVLPETPEEWADTEQALRTCASTLKSIMDLIGNKNDVYQTVNEGIKDFLKTYNEIEDHQKKLEKALCNLQILVLKTASLSLAQNQD